MLEEPFSSGQKDKTREEDLNLIKELKDEIYRDLKYFGLPSPWMRDIEKWRPHLKRIIAVEMEDRLIPDLMDRAYALGVLNKTTYLTGDVDKILQEGEDEFGRDITPFFPFEIINLDYCSGLLYDGFDRISALENLINRQAEHIQSSKYKFLHFLLFITHKSSLSSGKQAPFEKYLDYLASEITVIGDNEDLNLENVVDWYESEACPTEYRHKVFVLGKVLEFSSPKGFSVDIESIISYEGDHGAPMLHYQLKITPEDLDSPIPSDSGISPVDILNWPVYNFDAQDLAPERPKIHIS